MGKLSKGGRNKAFAAFGLAGALTAAVNTSGAAAEEPGSFYVRGEVGAARSMAREGNWGPPGFGDPFVFHRLTRPTTTIAGFAVGMYPFRAIRTELSFHHLFRAGVNGRWIYTVPATPGPHADMSGRVSSSTFMANAYIEPLALMGVDWPVQPFVGGGVGVAFNEMSPWSRINLAQVPQVRTFERGNNARLAWNAAAGVSVSLAQWTSLPITLDLTYRYFDLGNVLGGSQPLTGGSVPRRPFNLPLREQTLMAGVRMAIGGPVNAATFGFSGAGNFALPQTRNGTFLAICHDLGTNFFLIPGSNTCLAVGGNVRAEYGYISPRTRGDNASGFVARGQVSLDARSPTAYGALQTFIRLELQSSSGVFTNAATTPVLDRAFIRFGGLIFGRLPSMFDFYANALNFSRIGGSDSLTNQISYAMNLGRGYRFGIGIESSADRYGTVTDLFYSRQPPRVAAGFQAFSQASPTVVTALRYDSDTGLISALQTSAAVFEVRPTNTNGVSTWGYAVQAGARLNLPFIAPGNALWLQAAYAHGSLGYLGVYALPTSIGFQNLLQADAIPYTNTLNNGALRNEIKLTRGYSFTAAYLHNWTRTISQGVFGSVVAVNYNPLAEGFVVPSVPTNLTIQDTKIYQAGTNLVWTPISGFQIGAEVLYSRVDPKGRLLHGNGATKNYDDQVAARLRVLRGF